MLFGRQAERAQLHDLVLEVRNGTSGALVVRGDPGIGKTALLDDAVAAAEGVTVLRARGVESESELSFAGLAELLDPVLDRLPALPGPQAAALAGTLAIGPPVPADRFTVYAATLSRLAAAAERTPVLAVVDDAPWVDAPSREAIVFVARRLREEGVALLLAARTGEEVGTEAAEIPELRLGGLDREASLALLSGRADEEPIAPAVADRLIEATGGNPLGLIELGGLLSGPQRAGTEALEDPPPVGAGFERTFTRRLAGLPEATRHALVVAAASDSGDVDEVLDGLAAQGLERDALEPAERTGVVTITDTAVAFRHPLMRSVAYRATSAPDRRAAHRALAGVLRGERLPERRAWHLAAATVGSDEAVATELADAAAAVRERAGPAAAAPLGEKAARLTPDSELRARRLLETAHDLVRVGGPDRAQALLQEALTATDDPLLRADVQHLRALLEARGGSVAGGVDLLLDEAERVERLDPGRAVAMMMASVQPSFEAGRGGVGLATAERAHALATGVGFPPMPIGVPLAMALLLSNQRGRALPLLVEAADWIEQSDDPWAVGPVIVFGVGQAFIWLEDYDRARRVLEGGIRQAREWSAPALLPYGLLALCELDFRTGAWPSAYAAGSEGAELAAQTGQLNDQGYSLAVLARVEAAMGRDDDCRAHIAQTRELVELLGAEMVLPYLDSVIGLLELGRGRAAEAIPALERVADFVGERPAGDPGVLQWAPDLVEAYARAGRDRDAGDALSQLDEQATTSGGDWAIAATARCHGLLADDDRFEEHFAAALDRHRAELPFETARTQLVFGERLRRAGRRVDARAQLRAALETFERLGAEPWADRARAELETTGERVRRGQAAPTGELTPQELRVALVVAQGASNREAAAALFLSPKTIEFHLRNVYRKLGIRSRTQLVRVVLGSEGLDHGVDAEGDRGDDQQDQSELVAVEGRPARGHRPPS